MSLIKESPSVTKKDLSTIKDELGAFSTDAGGGERWQNLKTGVDLLNGSVLMPGEQLSVHDSGTQEVSDITAAAAHAMPIPRRHMRRRNPQS